MLLWLRPLLALATWYAPIVFVVGTTIGYFVAWAVPFFPRTCLAIFIVVAALFFPLLFVLSEPVAYLLGLVMGAVVQLMGVRITNLFFALCGAEVQELTSLDEKVDLTGLQSTGAEPHQMIRQSETEAP